MDLNKETTDYEIRKDTDLRVAILGASGSGKTTLAKAFDNAFGLKYIDSSAYKSFNLDDIKKWEGMTQGMIDHKKWNLMTHQQVIEVSNLVPEFGISFQETVLNNRLKLLRSKTNFITDRTPLDVLAYTLIQIGHNLSEKRLIDKFIQPCFDGTRENLTHIIFIDNTLQSMVEDDGRRIQNLVYQNLLVNTVMSGLIYKFLDHYAGDTKIMTLKTWNFENRVSLVGKFLMT